MKKLKIWFKRHILRQNAGWYTAGKSYTITVPEGKWTIGQKITIKGNKVKASKPTVTTTTPSDHQSV